MYKGERRLSAYLDIDPSRRRLLREKKRRSTTTHHTTTALLSLYSIPLHIYVQLRGRTKTVLVSSEYHSISYERQRGPGPEARSRGGLSRVGSKACRGPIKRDRKRVAKEPKGRRAWERGRKGPVRLHSLLEVHAAKKYDP